MNPFLPLLERLRLIACIKRCPPERSIEKAHHPLSSSEIATPLTMTEYPRLGFGGERAGHPFAYFLPYTSQLQLLV